MVELEKKYQVGVRRFGLVNWVGAYSLYKKEVLRFLIVSGQTLLGPILTSILFLVVISLAIGDERPDVLGVPYIEFLANGLIMMQVIVVASTVSCSLRFVTKSTTLYFLSKYYLSRNNSSYSIQLNSIGRNMLKPCFKFS